MDTEIKWVMVRLDEILQTAKLLTNQKTKHAK